MSYEPENHLPELKRHLEAVHKLVQVGFTTTGEFVSFGDAQDEDRVEFGMPFVRGDDVYWLNYRTVPCVLNWSEDDD